MARFSMLPDSRGIARPATAYGILASVLVMVSSAALPHHSARVTYDMDRVIEVEGEITSVLWRNPHARFTLMGVDAEGRTTPWNIETIPVTRLTRVGATPDLFSVGNTVKVAGFPARRPVNDVYAINMLLTDGRELLLDTPVARWTDDTIGTGEDATPGAAGADASLGIFRVWSTDGSFLRTETRFITEGGVLDYPLTEAARAAQSEWDPLAPDNIFRSCTPKGMPQIMQQPNPIEFVDRGEEILLRMEEFDTVRTIRMRGEAASRDRPATLLGHSAGRWEGDTLVVTTSGINWPHFDQNGLRQSEAIETIERFSLNDEGSRLDYELTVTDPWLFTQPVLLGKSWRWVPGDRVLPYECEE